jgi:hypothetical protein
MPLAPVIARLRKVNEPVPRPGRLPSEAEVSAAERELGITLHPDFAQYLLQASDVVYGHIEPVTLSDAKAHTHFPNVSRSAWAAGVPRDLVPICEDNGDYYCVSPRGEVVFWSHNGKTNERWLNIEHWIRDVWLGEGAL